MKAESMQSPVAKYEITFLDKEYVEIEFFNNITTKIKKEENSDKTITSYEYDYYRIKLKSRPNLVEQLNNNYDAWLKFAIDKENENKFKEPSSEERIKILEDTVDTLLITQLGGM